MRNISSIISHERHHKNILCDSKRININLWYLKNRNSITKHYHDRQSVFLRMDISEEAIDIH